MQKIKEYIEILEAVEETLESIEQEQVEEIETFGYGDWVNLLLTIKDNNYDWGVDRIDKVATLLTMGGRYYV